MWGDVLVLLASCPIWFLWTNIEDFLWFNSSLELCDEVLWYFQLLEHLFQVACITLVLLEVGYSWRILYALVLFKVSLWHYSLPDHHVWTRGCWSLFRICTTWYIRSRQNQSCFWRELKSGLGPTLRLRLVSIWNAPVIRRWFFNCWLSRFSLWVIGWWLGLRYRNDEACLWFVLRLSLGDHPCLVGLFCVFMLLSSRSFKSNIVCVFNIWIDSYVVRRSVHALGASYTRNGLVPFEWALVKSSSQSWFARNMLEIVLFQPGVK